MRTDHVVTMGHDMGQRAAWVVQVYFLAETMSKAYQCVYKNMMQIPPIETGGKI
mgnify:CR=1 FL=1